MAHQASRWEAKRTPVKGSSIKHFIGTVHWPIININNTESPAKRLAPNRVWSHCEDGAVGVGPAGCIDR